MLAAVEGNERHSRRLTKSDFVCQDTRVACEPGGKISICHNGNTLCVDEGGAAGHFQSHPEDTCGVCEVAGKFSSRQASRYSCLRFINFSIEIDANVSSFQDVLQRYRRHSFHLRASSSPRFLNRWK
jgi:hypothetical protein